MPGHLQHEKFTANKLGEGSLSPVSSVSSVNDDEISAYLHLYSPSTHGDGDAYAPDKPRTRTSRQYAEALKISRAASKFKLLNEKRPESSARSMRRLPTLDTYEKTVEFQAKAPTRVLVRLERLMGTEQVNISDPLYMKTLHSRLAQDEQKAWLRRCKLRMKAEEDRFRNLAIAGLVDPESDKDIADLYFHPVFRVNRILDRLAKVDREMFSTSKAPKHPIKPTEPFAYYERTGILFPSHKNHYLKPLIDSTSLSTMSGSSIYDNSNDVSVIPSRPFHIPHFTTSGSIVPISSSNLTSAPTLQSMKLPENNHHELAVPLPANRSLSRAASNTSFTTTTSNSSLTSDSKSLPALKEAASMVSIFTRCSRYSQVINDVRNQSLHYDEEEMAKTEKSYRQNFDDHELNEIKEKYGINTKEDLNATWNRHRSPLLELIEAKNGVKDMFKVSGKVVDAYKRKQLKTEDFCKKKYKHLFSTDK